MTQIFEIPEQCVIIRGAPGAGKTEQLIGIVEQAIQNNYTYDDIFVGSFSKMDAEKFQERLETKLPQNVHVQTIHSLCYKVVWTYILKVGSKKYLSSLGTLNIMTQKQIKECVLHAQSRHIELNHNIPPLNDEVDYQRYIELSKSLGHRPKFSNDDDRLSVYYHYQHVLVQQGLMDFGDLLLRAESILIQDSDIRQAFQYKVMLFDEVPDLSEQQMKVVELLCLHADKVIFAGDPTQSIYSFRGAVGADIEKRIKKIFPECKTIKLLDNHRSLPAVVGYAEKIFTRGMKSVRKLNTGKHPDGIVTIHPEMIVDDTKYAETIFGYVNDYKSAGYEYGEIHILCRTRADMAPAQKILTQNNIPNTVGGIRFTQKQECKDLVAWMKLSDPHSLLETPSKNHPFLRVYNRPPIKLTDRDGFEITNKDRKPMFLKGHWLKQFKFQEGNIEQRLKPSLYSAKYSRAIQHLLQQVTYIQSLEKPHDILCFVINIMKPSYRMYHGSREMSNKLDYLQMMIDLSEKFDTVDDFIEMLDNIERFIKVNAVEIGTIHGAKGRTDMKCVIHVDNPFVDRDKEEGKRIRYVATTRAEECLTVVQVAHRK